MVDGLTPEYLRHRARYWRNRADQEADPEKQAHFRHTAAILEREAADQETREPATIRRSPSPG
jgi:hypothetical protein